jgi:hypothetical protein
MKYFRGVLQSLVEKHFPAPDRNRIKKLLGNVGIELKHSKVQNGDSQGPSGSGGSGEKRKSGNNILILQFTEYKL